MERNLPTRALLLLAIGIFLVSPLWVVRYPPLVDYPDHLARAFILAHLDDPRFDFQQFYASAWAPTPYLVADILLIGLQQFLPIEVAGRVLLSICVLSVPLAAWFLIVSVNPDQEHLALVASLTCYNSFFLSGFISWNLSVPLCFLVLGVWIRYLLRPTAGRWLMLLALASSLYFTHLMGFAVAAVAVGVYSLAARLSLRRTVASWLVFLPGTALYFVWRGSGGLNWDWGFRPFSYKLLNLAEPIRGYSKIVDVVTFLALVVGCLACLWRRPKVRWSHPWLAVSGVLLALYFVIPDIKGSYLDARLPFYFLITGLLGADLGQRTRLLIPMLLLLLVLRVGNVMAEFRAAQPELESMARAIEVVPERARVFPVMEHKERALHGQTYIHFWAYGVIRRGWRSVHLFHQTRTDPHPLTMRQVLYSPKSRGGLRVAEEPDWSRIQQDYDFVWAYYVPGFGSQLASIGTMVYESGDLRVFSLRKSSNLGHASPGH